MKPNTTPRTMADAWFSTGHSLIEKPRSDAVYRWVCLLAGIAIGAILAIGV